MNNQIEISYLGERLDKTFSLLERCDHRISVLQQQFEELSKIVADYCTFSMKSQQKETKSIGIQVLSDNKVDSRELTENKIPEEVKNRLQSTVTQSHHSEGLVLKPSLQDAKGTMVHNFVVGQEIQVNRRISVYNEPINLEDDDKSPYSVQPLPQTTAMRYSDSGRRLAEGLNHSPQSKFVAHSPAATRSSRFNVPTQSSNGLPTGNYFSSLGSVGNQMSSPIGSHCKMPRRNVVIRESIIHPCIEESKRSETHTVSLKQLPNSVTQINQARINNTGGSNWPNNTCAPTSLSSSTYIPSNESGASMVDLKETLENNRKRRLPCSVKTIDPMTVASVERYNKMVKESWYGVNVSQEFPVNSTENNLQQLEMQDTPTIYKPKPLLFVSPTREWVPLEQKTSLTTNDTLVKPDENTASPVSSTTTGVIRRVVHSSNGLTVAEPQSSNVTTNLSDPLSLEPLNDYPPAVSTPSPRQGELQRSTPSSAIQQKIPALITISDNDELPLHKNMSAQSPSVSIVNLNRLIRFRPALHLEQIDKEILVLWNIPGLNDDQIAAIQNYELFGKQENPSNASANKWVKLASMKSLPLPMECRLSKFTSGYRYHFRIRAILKSDSDSKLVWGPFSESNSVKFN